MISCRNVAKLLMSDQLPEQSWWKRMEVRLHLAMCKWGSRLALQIEQLRAGARQVRDPHGADRTLEDRLIQRLSGQ